MTENASFNDQPIENPEADRYGIAPFARALAKSIEIMQAPIGAVLAIHGAWGSGKSSAINLIRHYLPEDKVKIADFKCWWFRGEEALTVAFLSQLQTTLGQTLGEEGRKVLKRLKQRLLNPSFLLKTGLTAASGQLGSAVEGFGEALEKAFDDEPESVEALYEEVMTQLRKKKQRFLIVIDDIDRLSPDEALQMFRLVKSVGRLPNVIYLLALDRALAEKIVAERYPSEGAHYLEKIIQAGFEIPTPKKWAMRDGLRQRLVEICGKPDDADAVRFENVLNDVVLPEMRTPRDVVRLENMLSVTWPAVRDEVDLADFVALETLRLRQPKIYLALREKQTFLCRRSTIVDLSDDDRAAADALLQGVPEPDHERYRKALQSIFVLLRLVWERAQRTSLEIESLGRARRAASFNHFETYFRFTIGDNVVRRQEIERILQMIRDGDKNSVFEILCRAVDDIGGGLPNRALLILYELSLWASEIAKLDDQRKLDFAETIFDLSKKIDEYFDRKILPDHRKYFQLFAAILRRPLASISSPDLAPRIAAALSHAPLSWRVYFLCDQMAREDDGRAIESQFLRKMVEETLPVIQEEARAGRIVKQRDLFMALNLWYRAANNRRAEVKRWTSEQLSNDDMVAQFARALMGRPRRGSADNTADEDGIAMSERLRNANAVIDLEQFRRRLGECHRDPDVAACLKAWPEHWSPLIKEIPS